MIISISGLSFFDKSWSGPQRICRALSNHCKIFHIELIGLKHLFQLSKPVRFFKIIQYRKNIYLLQLPCISSKPFFTFFYYWFCCLFLCPIINKKLKSFKPNDNILWIYGPESLPFVNSLDYKKLVFHFVDNYEAKYSLKFFKTIIIRQVRRVLRKIDFLFVTSKPLYNNISKNFKLDNRVKSFIFENRADTDWINDTIINSDLEFEPLSKFQKPIIGFAGALDPLKIDVKLIEYLADKNPEYSIVLAGKGKLRFNAIHKNIHLLGEVDYNLLPVVFKHFDVAIIPYKKNEYTSYISPLKLYEYLAARLSIVSTDVFYSEIDSKFLKTPQHNNYKQFNECVKNELKTDNDEIKRERIEFALKNSIQASVKQMYDIVFNK